MSYNTFSNMSFGEVAIYIAITLAITALCYCTIPIIFRFTLVRKKELTNKMITFIAVACSIIVFGIFLAINYPDVGGFGPLVLWGSVNVWILRSGNRKYHSTTKRNEMEKQSGVYKTSAVILAVILIAELANVRGEYIYWIEQGDSASEFFIDYIIRLLVHLAIFCTVPIIIRFAINKKPCETKTAIWLSVTFAIIGYFVLMGAYIYLIPISPDIDISILSAFVGYVVLTKQSQNKEDIAYTYNPPSETIKQKYEPEQKPTAETNTEPSEKTVVGEKLTEESNIEAPKKIISDAIEGVKPSTKKLRPKTLIIALSCLCAALVISIAVISVSAYTIIQEKDAEIEQKSKVITEYNPYRYASHFYIDNAVIIKKGDNTYYHRSECPQLGVKYSYMIHNVEAAKGKGYSECPVCFQYDKDTYIKTFY